MGTTRVVPAPARRPRRAETRRRLLTAAMATFAERGFYGASVEEICERAGFTRGAFYSNFASKEELFFALYAEQSQRLLTALAAAVAEVAAAAEQCDEIVDAALERYLAAHPDDQEWYLVNAEFTLHAVRHPEAARALAAHRAQVRGKIGDLLNRALAAVGRELTVEVDLVVRVMLALHDSSAESRFLGNRDPAGDLERKVLPSLIGSLSEPRVPNGNPTRVTSKHNDAS